MTLLRIGDSIIKFTASFAGFSSLHAASNSKNKSVVALIINVPIRKSRCIKSSVISKNRISEIFCATDRAGASLENGNR